MDKYILSPVPQSLKNHFSGGMMARSMSVMEIQYLNHSPESGQRT